MTSSARSPSGTRRTSWTSSRTWTSGGGRAAADRWIDDITEILGEVRARPRGRMEHGRAEVAARIAASSGRTGTWTATTPRDGVWVEQALAAPVELDESTRAGLHLAGGFVMWPIDQAAARVHWQLAVEKYRTRRRHPDAGVRAAEGGDRLPRDRRTSTTWRCELCDEGVELSRQIGDRPLIAPALNVRGELTRIAGRDDLARAAYEEGRDLSIAAGRRRPPQRLPRQPQPTSPSTRASTTSRGGWRASRCDWPGPRVAA